MRDTVLEQYLAKMGFLRDDYLVIFVLEKTVLLIVISANSFLYVFIYSFDNHLYLYKRASGGGVEPDFGGKSQRMVLCWLYSGWLA